MDRAMDRAPATRSSQYIGATHGGGPVMSFAYHPSSCDLATRALPMREGEAARRAGAAALANVSRKQTTRLVDKRPASGTTNAGRLSPDHAVPPRAPVSNSCRRGSQAAPSPIRLIRACASRRSSGRPRRPGRRAPTCGCRTSGISSRYCPPSTCSPTTPTCVGRARSRHAPRGLGGCCRGSLIVCGLVKSERRQASRLAAPATEPRARCHREKTRLAALLRTATADHRASPHRGP